MGFGFSCLQRQQIDVYQTNQRKRPPPPPRRKSPRPPPPPRKKVIVIDSTKHIKHAAPKKPSRKFKPKKRPSKKPRNPNKLNIPTHTRKKSISESEYSLTESYASALSALSPAVSVISALSVAPTPFISNASSASNLSEVHETSSESSISLIRTDNDTTASSLHSIADGYALVSHNEASSEANPSSTTNMMEYVNSVIQVHIEHNKPTLKIKPKTPSTSSSATDSLISYENESVYHASVHIHDEDDVTVSEIEGAHHDRHECHECHECSATAHHVKYGEDDESYGEESSSEVEEFTNTQTVNYLLNAPASAISTVSALSRNNSVHCGNIFQSNFSIASQLSELSELSVEERRHNNVVTPTMKPLSPQQCYFAVKSTSVTPHTARNISIIDPTAEDCFSYSSKVPDIARFLRDAQYYHEMDAIDDELAYVD